MEFPDVVGTRYARQARFSARPRRAADTLLRL
jgi:hypothetical protein